MFENVFDIKNHLFPWTFSRKLRLKQLFRPQSYRMVQILPVGALNLQDWNLSLQVCPPHLDEAKKDIFIKLTGYYFVFKGNQSYAYLMQDYNRAIYDEERQVTKPTSPLQNCRSRTGF